MAINKDDYNASTHRMLRILCEPHGWTDIADVRALQNMVRLAPIYRKALEQIACTTHSDDPCRKYVDIARAALRE